MTAEVVIQEAARGSTDAAELGKTTTALEVRPVKRVVPVLLEEEAARQVRSRFAAAEGGETLPPMGAAGGLTPVPGADLDMSRSAQPRFRLALRTRGSGRGARRPRMHFRPACDAPARRAEGESGDGGADSGGTRVAELSLAPSSQEVEISRPILPIEKASRQYSRVAVCILSQEARMLHWGTLRRHDTYDTSDPMLNDNFEEERLRPGTPVNIVGGGIAAYERALGKDDMVIAQTATETTPLHLVRPLGGGEPKRLKRSEFLPLPTRPPVIGEWVLPVGLRGEEAHFNGQSGVCGPKGRPPVLGASALLRKEYAEPWYWVSFQSRVDGWERLREMGMEAPPETALLPARNLAALPNPPTGHPALPFDARVAPATVLPRLTDEPPLPSLAKRDVHRARQRLRWKAGAMGPRVPPAALAPKLNAVSKQDLRCARRRLKLTEKTKSLRAKRRLRLREVSIKTPTSSPAALLARKALRCGRWRFLERFWKQRIKGKGVAPDARRGLRLSRRRKVGEIPPRDERRPLESSGDNKRCKLNV